MDADLAFCFGQFIDDQVHLIDSRLEKIKQEEIEEYEKIEVEKVDFNRRKPPAKNKGSYIEDQALVDQLVEDLSDDPEKDAAMKLIVDDPTCIDALSAETSTKINATANYLNRLRNLAQPLPNTSKFVQTCNQAIEYFRRIQTTEDNFKILQRSLEQSDLNDVVQNVQKWWKDSYGSAVADINRRCEKINPGLAENNFAILSPTSRVIDNAKRLMSARKIIDKRIPKIEIISKFVHRLLSIDEESRDKIDPDELIEQLNNSETKEIINYAKTWLRKREEIRNQKEEDPCT